MSGYLRKANFMQHMAQDGKLSGAGIESVDQCAMEHVIEQNERDRAHVLGSQEPYDPTDWEKRYRLRERMDHRKMLGGSTFQPGDGIERD